MVDLDIIFEIVVRLIGIFVKKLLEFENEKLIYMECDLLFEVVG